MRGCLLSNALAKSEVQLYLQIEDLIKALENHILKEKSLVGLY
jgi:hypothetical protein